MSSNELTQSKKKFRLHSGLWKYHRTHRVWRKLAIDFFKIACQSIPTSIDVHNLDEVATVSISNSLFLSSPSTKSLSDPNSLKISSCRSAELQSDPNSLKSQWWGRRHRTRSSVDLPNSDLTQTLSNLSDEVTFSSDYGKWEIIFKIRWEW